MSNVKDFRFLLYKVEQEDVIVKAFIQNETLWLRFLQQFKMKVKGKSHVI